MPRLARIDFLIKKVCNEDGWAELCLTQIFFGKEELMKYRFFVVALFLLMVASSLGLSVFLHRQPKSNQVEIQHPCPVKEWEVRIILHGEREERLAVVRFVPLKTWNETSFLANFDSNNLPPKCRWPNLDGTGLSWRALFIAMPMPTDGDYDPLVQELTRANPGQVFRIKPVETTSEFHKK